jgi:hypothetical protein
LAPAVFGYLVHRLRFQRLMRDAGCRCNATGKFISGARDTPDKR